MAEEPPPLYSVYRAQARSVVCYRWITQAPAQVGDFVSFLEAGNNFEWWDLPRAVGVSAWADQRKAAAIAAKKGFPLLAEIDLARADPMTPWAFTGKGGHVTIWAPAPLIIAAITNYIGV